MNAAVLVSYVVENGTYEGSAQRLADFWEYLSADSMIESNPFFRSWWDYWSLFTKDSATSELQDGFIQLKSLLRMGYLMFFIPLFHHLTRGFFIHSIRGSNIVTSH